MSAVHGKVVIVTGSTSGIGLAAALAFGERGAGVFFNGRSQSRLKKVLSLAKRRGINAAGLCADVSSVSGAERLIEGAYKFFGRVDVLVNNAGVGPAPRPFWETRPSDWVETIGTNLGGPLWCSAAYIRKLRKRNVPGRIIHISSTAGTRGYPGMTAYCVSKFGLRGLTECQSLDLAGSGIIVTCLELSSHKTPMTRRRFPSAEYARLAPPEDAMELLLYAATGPAELVHGRTLSERRFRLDPKAEASLNGPLATVAPWLPHMPRYRPGLAGPGALHLDFLENPNGPPLASRRALRQMDADSIARYPDPAASALRQRLAERLGVPPDCLTFGNGSSEILERVLRTFAQAGDTVVATNPTWPVFERMCRTGGIGVVQVPYVLESKNTRAHLELDKIIEALDSRVRLIYLVSPHNPLGTAIRTDEFRAFLDRLPAHLPVVVDEAYVEYSENSDILRVNEMILATERPLIGIRTFSKFFGLAGMRVGYAYAAPAVVRLISRLHLPFSVSSAAEKAAHAALDDKAHFKRTRETARAGRRQISGALKRLGLLTLESEANFMMAELPGDPAEVYGALNKKGIFLPEVVWNGFMQLPIGTKPENERYLKVLAQQRRRRHA